MIPHDFDENAYLRLNPDIANSKIDLKKHYIAFGAAEKRLYKFPDLNSISKWKPLKNRKTILVVCHEATRTGAPILGLNIVKSLSNTYNVITLLMSTGEIECEFNVNNHLLIKAPESRHNRIFADYIIQEITAQFKIHFCILNSVATLNALVPLAFRHIPTIGLIHEFASDLSVPHDQFREFLFWATKIIFSSKLTLDNAIKNYPDFSDRSYEILPQGKCKFIPIKQKDLKTESVLNLLRPHTSLSDTIVIVGAGTIQYRKGIDLFIECARKVVSMDPTRNYRFVWFGSTKYDPATQNRYLASLNDQISRSKLDGIVNIFEETDQIDIVYKNTDIFLLTSRLDPLPNVAIDCLEAGVPIVCFENASGIQEYFVNGLLKKFCVAEYLDPSTLAAKIVAILSTNGLRLKLSRLSRNVYLKHFKFDNYIENLIKISNSASLLMAAEKKDVEIIIKDKLFKEDFCYPSSNSPYHSRENQVLPPRHIMVVHYVRSWRVKSLGLRKPFPGFNPNIYQNAHPNTKDNDPLVDFIKNGKPKGPWWVNSHNLTLQYTNKIKLPKSICLHVHVFHTDVFLEQILPKILLNKLRPFIFISTDSKLKMKLISESLATYGIKNFEIKLSQNCGRDLGPFLNDFDFGEFDFVGHLHTKKSSHVPQLVSDEWNTFLLRNLLGFEKMCSFDFIINRLKENSKIGLIYPDDPNVIGWTQNYEIASKLAPKLGLDKIPLYFDFPVGNMFWARTEAIKQIFNNPLLSYSELPKEPIPIDGTTLHALERLIPLIAISNGYSVESTFIPGLTR